ncbi:MAG: YggT family protein [Kineosporiaceae bacterium]
MSIVFAVIKTALLLYLIALFARMALDWIRVFAREWRPRGPVLVGAVGVYSLTDPPLRMLRRIIPPLRIGQVALDLAFMLLLFVVFVAYSLVPAS